MLNKRPSHALPHCLALFSLLLSHFIPIYLYAPPVKQSGTLHA